MAAETDRVVPPSEWTAEYLRLGEVIEKLDTLINRVNRLVQIWESKPPGPYQRIDGATEVQLQ